MKRKNVISRFTTLALATLGCLLLALLVPAIFSHRVPDEAFTSSSVMASPRDMHIVTAPIQLSGTPDLILNRGALYADGNVASGLPSSRFVLDGPVFTLNASGLKATPEHLDSGFVGGAMAPLVEQLIAMGFDTLVIRRGTVHIISADGGTETLNDIEAELSGRRKGVIAGRGSLKLRGQWLKFDGTLSQNADKATPLRWPAKLAIKGDLVEATLDGHLDVAEDVQITGQTEIATPSLRRVARWFGVPIPVTSGLNAASLKGQFSWGRRNLAIDNAKAVIDGNEATGALTLNVAGERPLVDGTLAFTALDLTPYLEAARAQSFVFERLTSSWSEFDLAFPILKQFDADLRLSAPKIAVSGHGFGRGAAAITVRAGKLIADIAELELPNSGRASAQVTAESGDLAPRYAIRGKVENLDTGPVAAALFGTTVLSGRSTLLVDLTANGQTPAEVLRGLSGKATLSMPEGGRVALDMKALRGSAKANLGPGWGPLAKGSTAFDLVHAQAVLHGGVLVAEAVYGQTGSVALGASGRMDIVDGRLDLNVLSKSNVPTDRPLTLADLTGGYTVSVRGPWREPVVRGQDSDAGEQLGK